MARAAEAVHGSGSGCGAGAGIGGSTAALELIKTHFATGSINGVLLRGHRGLLGFFIWALMMALVFGLRSPGFGNS